MRLRRGSEASQLARERGGLAEAGWGAQEGETAGGEGIAEPPLERFSAMRLARMRGGWIFVT